MASMDSKHATAYLIDPLNAPEPSQETGPGTHFYPPSEASAPVASSSTNPYRRSSGAANTSSPTQATQRSTNGSPKGSPRSHGQGHGHARHSSAGSFNGMSKFPNYREEALGSLNEGPVVRRSSGEHGRLPSYDEITSGRRRGSSLKERYPGDESHKPLDVIRRDSKKAHRSPHLNKRHIPGADMIDRLDPTVNKIPYHHEGPYDAALLARNTDVKNSPVAALKETNAEAVKATAPENVKDAVEKHMPLDGVAIVPPGMPDRLGRTYDYEEGENEMMAHGGNYKRYPGVEYHPDDVHGQGEPSFSLDRALRAHTLNERNVDGQTGIEMSDRPLMGDNNGKRRSSRRSYDPRDPIHIAGDDARYTDLQHAADVDAHPVQRSGSLKDGLKRRIGSLRHKRADS